MTSHRPLLQCFLMVTLLTPMARAQAPATQPTPTLHPALFLVGDSIMKTGANGGQTGPWGMGYEIIPMFDANKIHVYNEGAGGRSSRGYIDEGLWGKILERIAPGDFVILMFGHNDEANSANYPDRATIKGSGEETVQIGIERPAKTLHTYGWYLRKYVSDAKTKGATLIICSPVPRNQWTDGKLKRGFDGYAQWAADAAKASGAPFIDLNTIAADRYEKLGQEGARPYFADTQHTTKIGARLNAECVIEGVKRLKDLPLAGFLLPTMPGAMTPQNNVNVILAAAEMPAGRVQLWNGKDITGWRIFLGDKAVDPKTVWNITDGVIKFDTKASGYMVTEKTYSDYHLHVEWRWPKTAVANSNSGVLVHLHGPDAVWPKCFEVQLKNGNAGQVVGMDLDIPAAPMDNNRKRAPKLAAASEKPLGEWNTYEIYVRGDTIEAFVNGVRQNFVEKLPVSSGAIALQMEGFPIEFRNVWLEPDNSKPAPSTKPASASIVAPIYAMQSSDSAALPGLFIVGDSTASDAKTKAPAVQGWGVAFGSYFDSSKINVVNAALGGRSSRSYIIEGHLDELVAKLHPGDTVLLQWGHNDAYDLAGPLRRGTLHGLGEETMEVQTTPGNNEVLHTFGWYMRKQIAAIESKGANPIILTLTLRDRWVSEGKIERLPVENLNLAHENRFHEPPIYSIWSAEIAKAAHLPLLDVHNMLADRYEREGKSVVDTYYNNPGDPTHRNATGAAVDAEVSLACLKAFKGAALDQYLNEKGKAVAPADAKYIFANAK